MKGDLTTFAETRVLPVVIAFAIGVLAMDKVRDYRDRELMESLARERVFYAGQDLCTPSPGQRSIQIWDDAAHRIHCEILENVGYGSAPRTVLRISLPTLDHPLGGGALICGVPWLCFR